VLAGVMKDDARVENVQTSGSIDITCGPGSTCRDVGGIVGAMNHSSYIYRSSASVPLTSSGVDVYYFGGLVGFIYGGSVEESYATGNVEASSGVGGLVGAMIGDSSTSRVSDSYATGDVHARGNFFSVSGGFVGTIDGGTITRSYSIGLATASTTAPGGFAGTLYGASVMIENSFTTALDVQIVNGGYMGGFAGGIYEGQVRNSAWVLIPDVDAVGLVGEEAACSIGNSKEYLIGEGLCNYGYDMGSASVFTFDGYFNGEGYVMAPIYEDGEESWDFENVWAIDEEGESNGGLPYLRWAVVDDNEEEQEEQEEEAPPAKKGGGSSSGSRSGASFSAVQQPAQTLEGIVNQYR